MKYHYDYAGNKITVLNPNDSPSNRASASYVYDARGNIVTVTDALGYSSQTGYDWLGRKVSWTDPKGFTYRYEYDQYNNLTKEIRPFEGGHTSDVSYTYDNNNNLLTKTVSTHKPGEAPAYTTTTNTYDNRNRRTATTTAGVTTKYNYDRGGNLTSVVTGGGAKTTTYAYDKMGNVTSMTDPMGFVERYYYDNNNNMTRKVDRIGNTTTYGYDYRNQLTSVRGTQSGATAKEFMNYTYAANGLLLKSENENLTQTYTYDTLGRVSKITGSDNTVREYGYDNNSNTTAMRLYVKGRLEINQTFQYDRLDRMTFAYDNGALAVKYAYDPNGNRSRMEYGNGMVTDYSYNNANLVTSVKNSHGGKTVSSYAYSYLLNGYQSGIVEASGVKTSYTYDALGRLTAEYRQDNGSALSWQYEYDPDGNRSRLTKDEDGDTTATVYTYDNNNRLTKEISASGGAQVITGYAYDKNGNQTHKMTSGISLKGDAGSPALRIRLIDDAYTNDPYSRYAGQLSGKLSLLQEGKESELTISMVDSTKKDTFQSEEYTYDAFNRLTKVVKPGTKAEYGYNAAGYRITKTVRGETTSQYWDGARLIAEGNTQGITDQFTYGLNLVKSLNEGYYVYNGHGDVVGIMDSGAITKEYRYDAFGVEDGIDQEDANPFRYAGEYFDEETGNIYLRARYYTPATGRFITEDPIKDGLNWYTYTMGNPVNYIDPSGLAMVNVRDYVTSRGGSVGWDNGYATFSLNGVTTKIPGSGNSRFTNVNGHLYAEDTYLMNLFGYHISNNNAKGTSKSSSGKTSNSRGSVGSSAGTRNMGNPLAMHPGGVGDSLPYGGGGTGGMPIGFEAWLVQVLGGTLGLVWGNKSHALPSDFDEDLLINFYIHHMTEGSGEDGNKVVDTNSDTVTSNEGNTYDNRKADNHSTTTGNPITGEPNSSVDILDSNGNVVRRRWYGPDGKVIRDLDYTDHGKPKYHPEVPHEHTWPNGVRSR